MQKVAKLQFKKSYLYIYIYLLLYQSLHGLINLGGPTWYQSLFIPMHLAAAWYQFLVLPISWAQTNIIPSAILSATCYLWFYFAWLRFLEQPQGVFA